MVSPKLLKELAQIIKEEYARDLNMEEISEIGNGIVNYFDLLAKIEYANDHDSNINNFINK